MPHTVQKLKIDPAQGPALIATALNDLFALVGAVDLQDVQFYRDEALQVQGSHFLLTFNDPGAVTSYAAISFIDTVAQSAEAQADSFFTANPSFLGHFLVDVTEERRRRQRPGAIVIIYTTSYETPCAIGQTYPRAVQADGAINAGATGTASLVTASGVDATNQISVRNTRNFVWPDGEEGWAVYDPFDCEWVGFPTCCSSP